MMMMMMMMIMMIMMMMISKFNGTSTPKGSYSAKTGIKCPVGLSSDLAVVIGSQYRGASIQIFLDKICMLVEGVILRQQTARLANGSAIGSSPKRVR